MEPKMKNSGYEIKKKRYHPFEEDYRLLFQGDKLLMSSYNESVVRRIPRV